MGKAECEMVPFRSFWLETLPGLGLIDVVGSNVGDQMEYTITATKKGFDVCDDYYAGISRKSGVIK